MSLSDNLRRLARERIPTAPAKWLGPITPTVYTNDSTRYDDLPPLLCGTLVRFFMVNKCSTGEAIQLEIKCKPVESK